MKDVGLTGQPQKYAISKVGTSLSCTFRWFLRWASNPPAVHPLLPRRPSWCCCLASRRAPRAAPEAPVVPGERSTSSAEPAVLTSPSDDRGAMLRHHQKKVIEPFEHVENCLSTMSSTYLDVRKPEIYYVFDAREKRFSRFSRIPGVNISEFTKKSPEGCRSLVGLFDISDISESTKAG